MHFVDGSMNVCIGMREESLLSFLKRLSNERVSCRSINPHLHLIQTRIPPHQYVATWRSTWSKTTLYYMEMEDIALMNFPFWNRKTCRNSHHKKVLWIEREIEHIFRFRSFTPFPTEVCHEQKSRMKITQGVTKTQLETRHFNEKQFSLLPKMQLFSWIFVGKRHQNSKNRRWNWMKREGEMILLFFHFLVLRFWSINAQDPLSQSWRTMPFNCLLGLSWRIFS